MMKEKEKEMRGCRNEELRALAERDVAAKRRECPFTPPWCPRGLSLWMEAGLADTRDRVMAELLTCICTVTLPLAACVFAMDTLHVMGNSRRGVMLMHAIGMAYLVFNEATFLQRFVLTLHYSEHRGLWAKTNTTTTTKTITKTTTRSGNATNAVNIALSRVRGALVPMLCPFFGVPPGVYRLHHCVMHHVEGNAPGDMTSTQRFQRDSALHFVLYVAAMLASILLLPVYALTRARRVDLAARSAVAILAYASAMRGLHARAPIATLYVFVLPLIIVFAALAFGNWSQHLFITHHQSSKANGDASSAGLEGGEGGTHDEKKKTDNVNLNHLKHSQSAYTMAYNCIAAAENQTTYNDGYHVVHHANSRTHWSELPQRFIDTLDIHEANATLVFRDVHFMEVGAAATFGGERGLRWLATKLVSYDAHKKSHRGDDAKVFDDDTNDELDTAMKVHILRDRLGACPPPPSFPAPPRPRHH